MGTQEYKSAYKNLTAYIKANELTLSVYKVTKRFPKDELFGLVSQMRRCAVSVMANIVEGYGRRTAKDKLQFCYISRGSLNELECYIDLSFQLEYISQTEHELLMGKKDEAGKLLAGFIKSLSL